MDGADLGQELRARRKAAGRTIASVAADAGLSVPYIANLENGRGNPTLAALGRLAEALGARLAVSLTEVDTEEDDAAEARRLLQATRARAVIASLPATEPQVLTALTAIAGATGRAPNERDLNRLLDLLLLATDER
ncbi:XRE family transcriptional regulator [Streptomyces sp. 8K308]|uniref:helix-turn-helix domain-containing protein n=1 Tax=Streptomyces sp. 8K308 TaxID=2530388 RepID=UPI001044348E|nr:helix-turn-helix transcriptional regulator [Streptomyces sp. 8K308]TDC13233.1 XRE family transcriptional regulator [Streptomyces sp. 8K308]